MEYAAPRLARPFGMKAPHQIAWWFFGVWIALAIVGLWVTYGDKNVARKKRLLPIFIVGSGIIFGVFALTVIGDLRALALVAPTIALIIFLNLRQLRVRPTCGRIIHSGMLFAKARYCSRCGDRLD
jgi:hypothetical protein